MHFNKWAILATCSVAGFLSLGAMQPAATASATATTTTAPAAPAVVVAPPVKMVASFDDSLPKNTKPTPKTARIIANFPDMIRRISAYGRVCVQGQPCSVVVPAAAPAPGAAPRSGEEVYTSVCTNCHGVGMLGSPKTGDKAAWAPRIAKGKDTLYQHALNGFNAMPARGGGELTDQEVKNGVDYLVSKGS